MVNTGPSPQQVCDSAFLWLEDGLIQFNETDKLSSIQYLASINSESSQPGMLGIKDVRTSSLGALGTQETRMFSCADFLQLLLIYSNCIKQLLYFLPSISLLWSYFLPQTCHYSLVSFFPLVCSPVSADFHMRGNVMFVYINFAI